MKEDETARRRSESDEEEIGRKDVEGVEGGRHGEEANRRSRRKRKMRRRRKNNNRKRMHSGEAEKQQ